MVSRSERIASRCIYLGVVALVIGCGGSDSASHSPRQATTQARQAGPPTKAQAERALSRRPGFVRGTCAVVKGDYWSCPYINDQGMRCEAAIYRDPQPHTFEICKEP